MKLLQSWLTFTGADHHSSTTHLPKFRSSDYVSVRCLLTTGFQFQSGREWYFVLYTKTAKPLKTGLQYRQGSVTAFQCWHLTLVGDLLCVCVFLFLSFRQDEETMTEKNASWNLVWSTTTLFHVSDQARSKATSEVLVISSVMKSDLSSACCSHTPFSHLSDNHMPPPTHQQQKKTLLHTAVRFSEKHI